MNYDFRCEECKETWEQNLPLADRDNPLTEPCPKCKKEGCVKRCVSAGTVNYQGFISPITRAGDGWNDVLKKVHSTSGKQSKIETN